MTPKKILVNAIKVIALLFGAFGSFFLKIAPPDETGIGFAVGLGSTLSLIALLLINFMAKKYPPGIHHRSWLSVSICCIIAASLLSLCYYHLYNRYTFAYPKGGTARYMQGMEMIPKAQHYMDSAKYNEISLLVADYGLKKLSRIWTPEAVEEASLMLMGNYIFVVVFFIAGILTLVEMISQKHKT